LSSKTYADGIERCSWVTEDEIYLNYHDTEWGNPKEDQQGLFEAICLEGFQAGLSWLTILRRRENFRSAFFDFDIAKVAAMTALQVDELMKDSGIIRNRAKILSAIKNANIILDKRLDLTTLIWRHEPDQPQEKESGFEWQTSSPESEALSRELKSLGFSFVGPTTMYALMQSCGVIKDHAPNCFRSA
jgi:DNA-3-methyladenine glycosylase I